jgi:hypothetical protein
MKNYITRLLHIWMLLSHAVHQFVDCFFKHFKQLRGAFVLIHLAHLRKMNESADNLRHFAWRVDARSKGKTFQEPQEPVVIAEFITGKSKARVADAIFDA